MPDIAALLANAEVRSWYLIFCFAVMFVPMIGLSLWYHLNIRSTSGGRALMDRQNRSHLSSHRSMWDAAKSLGGATDMARDIEHGKYGGDARRMQTIVWWVVGLWLIANVVCFGILIWADEVNKAGTAG